MRLNGTFGALLAALLIAAAALGAEEPEAVYAKFHRAAMAGNLAEMLKYGPAQRRAEMARMSAAQQEAELKMVRMLMPRAFTLLGRTPGRDGRSARLLLSGPGQAFGGGRPETLYGAIDMVLERGEWKVREASWSNDKPAAPRQARPAAAPPAPARASSATTVPVAPGQKDIPRLGAARPECVYKPVMTQEDIERCR
ncbi:MAG: hypothetical protein HYS35_03030 [Betaproteobacteria bacterium]|nr:hypothetical protein [Betaproteobacteria bacterium]